MLTPDMKLALRTVTRLDEALALAPLLDASAAEFHAQCSDDPYPEGASERFLRAHLAHPASVLIVAEEQGAPPASRAWGVCVTGPFTDPLLGTLQPMGLRALVGAHGPRMSVGIARGTDRAPLETGGDVQG
jgi:hypothetical protein